MSWREESTDVRQISRGCCSLLDVNWWEPDQGRDNRNEKVVSQKILFKEITKGGDEIKFHNHFDSKIFSLESSEKQNLLLHNVPLVCRLKWHKPLPLCFCWTVLDKRYSFPGGSDGEESACSARGPGSVPGSGPSPGEGNGYPLQYSCLEKFCGQRSLVG